MNQETFLRIQTIELQGLLEQSADDPIIGPQLQERLADAQKELDAETRMPDSLWRKEPFSLPRATDWNRNSPRLIASNGGDFSRKEGRLAPPPSACRQD